MFSDVKLHENFMYYVNSKVKKVNSKFCFLNFIQNKIGPCAGCCFLGFFLHSWLFCFLSVLYTVCVHSIGYLSYSQHSSVCKMSVCICCCPLRVCTCAYLQFTQPLLWCTVNTAVLNNAKSLRLTTEQTQWGLSA